MSDTIKGIPCIKNISDDIYVGGTDKDTQDQHLKQVFPCMDKMVQTKVKSCLPCQVITPVYTREPLQMSVLPDSPFDEVSVDGQTLLLVVDDYSRFPFVEPVSSTSASAVIPKLDQLFSTFEAPRVVKSDNGHRLMEKSLQSLHVCLVLSIEKLLPSGQGLMEKLRDL